MIGYGFPDVSGDIRVLADGNVLLVVSAAADRTGPDTCCPAARGIGPAGASASDCGRPPAGRGAGAGSVSETTTAGDSMCQCEARIIMMV